MTKDIWIGLDVHKDSIVVAILEGRDRDGEVVRLPADLNQIRKLFRQLAARGTVHACYEASGAGFVLHRALAREGFSCQVIAPSLIPRKPGDRRKTDRRDALGLARALRNGDLTPVEIPSEELEALRTLVRARLALLLHLKKAKQQIHSLLLSQGFVFRESKSYWTRTHRAWLAQRRKELQGPLAVALGVHLDHFEYLETQLRALDAQLEEAASRPPFRPLVEALTCLRGVRTLTAMVLVTEIGDIRRFRSPRTLMAFTGLVPSERSSGNREQRGPITKTGNVHVRRVLVEAAQNNRTQARSTLILDRRRQGQPPAVVAIAVKAQHRLSKRYWHLIQHKHHNVAVTALARELAGFVWAILHTALVAA